MLHRPQMRNVPMAVGGDPQARHGIVLTANYLAKRQGVKTGMALWQARQVCPDIQFVPPRMDLYLRFSRMAHEIYRDYTDLWEPYGCDEVWMDVPGSCSLMGDGLTIAQDISRRIKSRSSRSWALTIRNPMRSRRWAERNIGRRLGRFRWVIFYM